jgi:hypothetical protein
MTYYDTTVPIPIEDIKQYFNNKDIVFNIDYTSSKLKDRMFLTYLSNLDLPANINTELDNIEVEEWASLIKSYMELNNINDIPVLNNIIGYILFYAIGQDIDDSNLILKKEDISQFIEDNTELVQKWIIFLNSSLVYLIYIFKDLKDIADVEHDIQEMDDADYVGMNIVNLIKDEDFLLSYYGLPANTEDIYFFKQQFTTYMFKGKPLYHYYIQNKPVVNLFNMISSGQIPTTPHQFNIDEWGING